MSENVHSCHADCPCHEGRKPVGDFVDSTQPRRFAGTTIDTPVGAVGAGGNKSPITPISGVDGLVTVSLTKLSEWLGQRNYEADWDDVDGVEETWADLNEADRAAYIDDASRTLRAAIKDGEGE